IGLPVSSIAWFTTLVFDDPAKAGAATTANAVNAANRATKPTATRVVERMSIVSMEGVAGDGAPMGTQQIQRRLRAGCGFRPLMVNCGAGDVKPNRAVVGAFNHGTHRLPAPRIEWPISRHVDPCPFPVT